MPYYTREQFIMRNTDIREHGARVFQEIERQAEQVAPQGDMLREIAEILAPQQNDGDDGAVIAEMLAPRQQMDGDDGAGQDAGAGQVARRRNEQVWLYVEYNDGERRHRIEIGGIACFAFLGLLRTGMH